MQITDTIWFGPSWSWWFAGF